jgi:hypothetical protein
MTILEALKAAITALNDVPNFTTRVPDPSNPGTFFKSYNLIPHLEKAVKNYEKAK